MAESVELPPREQAATEHEVPTQQEEQVPRPETPSTNQPASEQAGSTVPTTPSSAQPPASTQGEVTPTATKAQKTAAAAVSIMPAVPKTLPKETSRPASEKATDDSQSPATFTNLPATEAVAPSTETAGQVAQVEEPKPIMPAPKAWSTPKSWTGLFNSGAPASSLTNGHGNVAAASGLGNPSVETLAESLRSFSASSNDAKVAFLEPRGLVNTGNMCYMNSVSFWVQV